MRMGARKVCKGSTEVRECAWKGAQGCAKVRKGARMCTKGAQRECKGAQGCARVRECAQKGAQWCTKVCEGVRMCTKRCAIVRKRCARCAEVHERECRGARKGAQVGPEPGQIGQVVRVWWVQAQCRESQRSRKISKNTRPGGVWGECQLSLEGSGSPGGGGEPEWVRVPTRKIEN